LIFSSIHLTSAAIGQCSYNGAYSAHSCIDYEFTEFDRSSGDTLIIEFDAIWESATTNGDGGRADVFLLHEYKSGGPQIADYSDSTQNHYGRPGYNLRIFNGSKAGGMVIGGGQDSLGKLLFYNASGVWTPGFLAAKPADYIDEWRFPVDANDMYPNVLSRWRGVFPTIPIYSITTWKHYTWMMTNDRLHFFWRNSKDTVNQKLMTLITPLTRYQVDTVIEVYGSFIDSLFGLYHYYDKVSALRFYWRGAEDFWLANVKITKAAMVTAVEGFGRSIEKRSVQFFPNPSSGRLSVQFYEENALIEIVDITGRRVFYQMVKSKGSVDLNGLAPGCYVCCVTADGITQRERLVIRK